MFVCLISFLTCLSSLAVGCTASLHGPVSRRIVRGFEVDIKAFPYAVFLYFNLVRPSACGSSLITVRAVVTSAYCIREMKLIKGEIHAFLGASIPMYSKVVRNLTAYRIHPKYDENRGKFDLSVAIFNREVPMIHGIRRIPICRKSIKLKDVMYTAGWGKTWVLRSADALQTFTSLTINRLALLNSNKFPTVKLQSLRVLYVKKPIEELTIYLTRNVMPDYSDARSLQASMQKLVSNSQCLNKSGIQNTPVYLCSVPLRGFHYRGDLGNGLVTLQPFLALVGVVSFMVKDATLYANVMYQRDWLQYSLKELYGKMPLEKDCC